METFFCKAPQFLPPLPLAPSWGEYYLPLKPKQGIWGEKTSPLKCSLSLFFPESVCFCCLDFPWWQRTKRSTVEQFQQSQTQCLYWEFLSLAQTHRPTAEKDKVNHRLCFLLASRPAEGPYLTPPLALLRGAESVDSLRRQGWKMRRPSRRIFTEAPHQQQVTVHVLIEDATKIDSVRWVSCQPVRTVCSVRTEEEMEASCWVCFRLTLA